MLCIKSIFTHFSRGVILTYVFTCIIIYELQVFFSRGIASGLIDYDFETSLFFSRNPSSQVHRSSPLIIIYDQKVFWHTLKNNYVTRVVIWWIGVEKLSVLRHLYYYIVTTRLRNGQWYDVILTLISYTLNLLFIAPRVFMVLFYSVYILYELWGLYKSNYPKDIFRLYISELFQTFYFFKVLVPKSYYSYVVGKGLTYYATDITMLSGDFKNFGFYTPLKLSFIYNVLVAPYYIAFRKVQSLVWLLSPLQSFYVVTLTNTRERFIKPDDLRGMQVPLLRLKKNTQPLYIRLLSATLFLLIDHVRTIVSLPAIMYGCLCLKAYTWNKTTKKLERLTLDHTLKEGWEGVMNEIFSMQTLRGCITLYVPDTLKTYLIGLSTQNLDIDNPNWPKNTRFTISTKGDGKLFIKRPTHNWSYSGIYFHTALAEFFFKLEWRYLLRDTRNFWCHKETESILWKIKRRLKFKYKQ